MAESQVNEVALKYMADDNSVKQTNRYKAYPEYKDSGVEWLGEIPSGWELLYGKRLFESIREKALDTDEQLAASQKYGVIPQSLMMRLNDSKVMLALKGTETFRHVEKDNFVISLRSFEGGIEHSNYTGCVSPAYTVLKFKKNLSPRFFKYLFKSKPYIAALQSSTDSLRDGKSISYDQFGSIILPVLSFDEQEKIANFLDFEIPSIDKLIEKQQRLIELLTEKRQAVISHAVTKGLNPDVPMKDSGVEWLGEVPDHWEVSKLKYYSGIQGGYAFNSQSFKDNGIQVLKIANVYQNRLALERQPTYVSEKMVDLLPEFVVHSNDILMSLTGTLGKRDYGFAVKVDSKGKYLLNQRVAKLNPVDSKVNRDFLVYTLWSESYLNQLYSLPSGTKQANLSNSDVLDIWIAIPPTKAEQKEIASKITNKKNIFDQLVLKAQQAIQLMQERRTALISAAVTGKIDVRDWVKPDN